VAALLHDIGDIYAPYNHDEYAASIIRPFVREQVAWVVEKHGDFQMIYYGEHVGADPEKRQAYAGHAYFDDCAVFCERWDQSSFNPDFDTLPLSHFADRVREVFARAPYAPDVIRTGIRVPLGAG
jgi:predicted HD phosphohydrolase